MLEAPFRIECARSIPIASTWVRVALLSLTLASLVWFVFFAGALLLKYPPVSVDEALFANPAINLIEQGRMSTDLLEGTLPGIGQRTYWMPPLYFLYVGGVFRLAGQSLVVLRLASEAAAFAVLFVTYLLSLRTGVGRWMSLIPVCLMALDTVFLRGALVGRMDMLALSLILLSLWFATRPLSPGNSFVTGIVSALAILAHPIE